MKDGYHQTLWKEIIIEHITDHGKVKIFYNIVAMKTNTIENTGNFEPNLKYLFKHHIETIY